MYRQKHSWLLGIRADPSMLWNYMELELFLLLITCQLVIKFLNKCNSSFSCINNHFQFLYNASSSCEVFVLMTDLRIFVDEATRKTRCIENIVVRCVTNELGVLIASWSPIRSLTFFGGSVFPTFFFEFLSIALFSSKEKRESKNVRAMTVTPHSNTIDDLKMCALRRQQWLCFFEGTSKNYKSNYQQNYIGILERTSKNEVNMSMYHWTINPITWKDIKEWSQYVNVPLNHQSN